MRREKSAGAVVYNPKIKKYLLLHYPIGHWDFPKGHVEENEDEIQACLREVKEETGLDIETLFGFRDEIKYYFRDKGELVEKRVAYFIGITENEDVKLSYEHDDYRWLDYEDSLKYLKFETSKKILREANTFLKRYKF